MPLGALGLFAVRKIGSPKSYPKKTNLSDLLGSLAPLFNTKHAFGWAATPIAPDQPNYDSQSAKEKLRILQEQIEFTEYQQLPQWTGTEPLAMFGLALAWATDVFKWAKGGDPIRGLVRDFFSVSLERNSDVMPEGRKKAIHTYGSTAAIKFVADDRSPFTGLFKGVSYGLARLSLAAKPAASGTAPGIGVKFLVDGQPSANFVAMYSVEGQQSYNFFANEFSTFIGTPVSCPKKMLMSAFATATADPTKVDSAFLAKTNQDGTVVTQPVAPEKLIFVPNRQQLAFENGSHEVRDDFKNIAADTVLYRVYGVRTASEERIYIGDIVTTSRFVASQFGDEKLFFRHQRFNDK